MQSRPAKRLLVFFVRVVAMAIGSAFLAGSVYLFVLLCILVWNAVASGEPVTSELGNAIVGLAIIFPILFWVGIQVLRKSFRWKEESRRGG
jgi:NhaP-type Na+/H+ or K+/H+ antiporter